MNGIIFLCYRILIFIIFSGVCVKAQIIEKYNVETQNKDTIKVIPEVVIQKNKNKNKNIGLRSKSKKIVFAIYPNRNNNSLSKEFATKFKTKKEIKIRNININIAKFDTEDLVKMEINIYNEKNDFPDNSVLKEKLIIDLDKYSLVNNEIKINVENMNINIKGTFFVGFKVLSYFDGDIYVSGGILKGSVSRKKGESWQKISLVSPSINLDIL